MVGFDCGSSVSLLQAFLYCVCFFFDSGVRAVLPSCSVLLIYSAHTSSAAPGYALSAPADVCYLLSVLVSDDVPVLSRVASSHFFFTER